MHFANSLLVASMATLALAAPTPNRSLVKRSFAVPAKGRHLLAPYDEMWRAYRKYGWEIIFLNPDDGSYSEFPPRPSSSAPAFPGGYGYASSSVPPFPFPTASAPAYGPPSSGVVPPMSTGVPSGVPMPTGTGAPFPSGPVPSYSASANGTIPSSSAAPPMSSAAPPTSSAAPSTSSAAPPASSAAPPAPSSSAPADDGDTGEVNASPEQYESEYLSPVSIGGQTLNLNFDTGSADLWVFSTELPGGEQAGHSLYNPTKSSSWSELDGATWQIQYGDGSTAGGIVGYDKVSVGDATVTRQAVELATEVSAQFMQDENSDGLLGLAFSVLNTVQPEPQKTWFENIQDELEAPVFTADLEEDASGTYEFGVIDHNKYSGQLHYTPIDKSNGWWQFPSEFITVGGQKQQCGICSPAIADTGTSLLLLDDDVVEAYYEKVDGAQYNSMQAGYTYPCDANLPDFGVAIGPDYTAVLTGQELTYAEIGDGTCFGGVQGNGASTGSGTPVQIIGDVLLKQYFAVFDAGNLQFGIAKKN